MEDSSIRLSSSLRSSWTDDDDFDDQEEESVDEQNLMSSAQWLSAYQRRAQSSARGFLFLIDLPGQEERKIDRGLINEISIRDSALTNENRVTEKMSPVYLGKKFVNGLAR